MVRFGFEDDEHDEMREKLQTIRMKFMRLAHRLGQTTPNSALVTHVLKRLELAEQNRGINLGPVASASNINHATVMAQQFENQESPLDFTCTILILGKSGVGKSSTINSLFDKPIFDTDPFDSGTKKIRDTTGTIQGIKIRVIDTPGFQPSWSDHQKNEKLMISIKKFICKSPPDVVFYIDRYDTPSRNTSEDLPLLHTITKVFGPTFWDSVVVLLTHSQSGVDTDGTQAKYDKVRADVVQQAIRQAKGDMELQNPFSLVENNSDLMPNGKAWRPPLLLLSLAFKILADANKLLKVEFPVVAERRRSPPRLFSLISSLFSSNPEVKLPTENVGDAIDDALVDDEDPNTVNYDELPSFRPLTKAEMQNLSESLKKTYYEEVEYRGIILEKSLRKEEKASRKLMTKDQLLEEEMIHHPKDYVIPYSFDSDNLIHLYNPLPYSTTWLFNPVQEPLHWDHDIGLEGTSVENIFIVEDKVPVSFSCNISKNKTKQNIQMEIASTVKRGKGKAITMGLDMNAIGNEMSCTLKGETRLSKHSVNKAVGGLTAGFSATLMDRFLSGGVKVKKDCDLGKLGELEVTGGGFYGGGDTAYGCSVDAKLGWILSVLGVSVLSSLNGNLSFQGKSVTTVPVGRCTNLIGKFNMDSMRSGKVSLGVRSVESVCIALIGLIPFLVTKIMHSMSNDRLD